MFPHFLENLFLCTMFFDTILIRSEISERVSTYVHSFLLTKVRLLKLSNLYSFCKSQNVTSEREQCNTKNHSSYIFLCWRLNKCCWFLPATLESKLTVFCFKFNPFIRKNFAVLYRRYLRLICFVKWSDIMKPRISREHFVS